MRVLVLLIAFSLVWGSCKKKDPCNDANDCRPEIKFNFYFLLKDKTGKDFLTLNEALNIKHGSLPLTPTNLHENVLYILGPIKDDIQTQYFYINFIQNDVDTLRVQYSKYKNMCSVWFNTELVAKEFSVFNNLICDTCLNSNNKGKPVEIIKNKN